MVRERQLKAFAASVSARGQKIPFARDQLVEGDSAVTLIDPSVQLTAKQLKELPLPSKTLLFRFVDSFTGSPEEAGDFKSLLGKGIDAGLLKKNDYFEIPLMRLILLHVLGTKALDLGEAMPWGGISERVERGSTGFDKDLAQRLSHYHVEAEKVAELSQFNSFISAHSSHFMKEPTLNFVADGVRLGLIYKLNSVSSLSTDFVFDLLSKSLDRDCGQVVIHIIGKQEVQISYFINSLEGLSQSQSKRVGWFVIGANHLLKAD